MSRFLRSFLPLLLVAVLGLAAAPAHAGMAEHSMPAGHALHDDGHCTSHQGHGHATAAECLQIGHCVPLSPCASGLPHSASNSGLWHAAHEQSARPAPSEALTPPPRSA